MPIHLGMPDKIPRDASARTFETIEKVFEHVYRALRQLNGSAGSVDLSSLEAQLAALQASVTALQAAPPDHNLLSLPHADTIPAAAARGAVVVGEVTGGGDGDAELYWRRGGLGRDLVGDQATGGGAFFARGGVYPGLGTAASAKWTRVVPSTPNQGLVYNGATTDFGPVGDVSGPASAVDGRVAVFDGATGKLIRDGGATLVRLTQLGAPLPDSGFDDSRIEHTLGPVGTLVGGQQVGPFVYQATYTPTWDMSGTPPTLGNGTITGSFYRIGKLVYFTVQMILGSTSSFGTGYFIFSVPVTSNGNFLGNARLVDAGVANYAGQLFAHSVTQVGILIATGGLVSATAPFSWGTSDEVNISGVFVAAT